MCDRGRTITNMQIPRFHTQVWYKNSQAKSTGMRWDNRSIEEVNAEDVMTSCNPLESTGLGTAQEANKG